MPKVEIDVFRTTRERTISLVAGLSEDDMASSPAPGKWSAGELVDHLLRAESLWRREVEQLIELQRSGRQPYLSRLLADFPVPIVGRLPMPLVGLFTIPLTVFNTFLPARFFESFLRLRALPAPAPTVLTPQPGRAGDELREDLKNGLQQTVAVFEDNDDLHFQRLLYQHPFFGVVNAVGLLRLISAHERRHQDQLREILAQLGIRSGG